MNIQYYSVNDKKLLPYIDYYYTLKNADPNFTVNYLAFPHLNTPLCFLKNCDVEFAEHKTAYRAIDATNVMAISWGMFVHPMEIDIVGQVDKVCIVFKPLGLNYFIRNTFSNAVNKNCGQFTSWEGNEYNFLASRLFATESDEVRIKLLEQFLISQFNEISQESFLQKLMSLITDIEQDLTIDCISKKMNVTHRTLTRVCQNHLGASPIELKKIARFRHSLKFVTSPKKLEKSFSELGLNSKFYDQSHFIKAYQQLTGNTPKSFFKSIEIKANNNFILQVLK